MTISCATQGPHLGSPTNIHILEHGSYEQPAPEYCQEYKLSAREVRAYLIRARIVSRFESLELYDHGPCYLRGTADFSGRSGKWELVISGTGEVRFDEDFIVLIADPKMQGKKL
jgi:hypothetical protein